MYSLVFLAADEVTTSGSRGRRSEYTKLALYFLLLFRYATLVAVTYIFAIPAWKAVTPLAGCSGHRGTKTQAIKGVEFLLWDPKPCFHTRILWERQLQPKPSINVLQIPFSFHHQSPLCFILNTLFPLILLPLIILPVSLQSWLTLPLPCQLCPLYLPYCDVLYHWLSSFFSTFD